MEKVSGAHCTVGTHLAKQGKNGICFSGELFKDNIIKI
jgi:hypothetical protein